MIPWVRVVLPRLEWCAGGLLICGGLTAYVLSLEWQVGQPLPEARKLPAVSFGLLAVIYGGWRVFNFHPIIQRPYRAWLATIPWTSRKPLPAGPVRLVAQDVVLLGTFAVLAWPVWRHWVFFIILAFAVAYLVALDIVLFLTEEWVIAYAVAFLVAACIPLWQYLPLCAVMLGLTYGLAWLGLERSLARFPWRPDLPLKFDTLPGYSQNSESKSLGWPFGRLAPRMAEEVQPIPLLHATFSSLLVGWWIREIVLSVPDRADADEFIRGLLMLVTASAPILRVGVYLEGYAPPISLMGRILTGRWIIKGYDQVFVAPLLAYFVGESVKQLGDTFGIAPDLYAPLGISLVLFVVLTVGPSLRTWRLTGNHRIAISMLRSNAVKVG